MSDMSPTNNKYTVPARRAGKSAGARGRLIPAFGSFPPQEPRVEDFYPFLKPGTSAWKDYFEFMKVIAVPGAVDGSKYTAVTKDIQTALGDREVGDGNKAPLTSCLRNKTYELVQLLTDNYLISKFRISLAMRARLKTLATTDPNMASDELQRYVRKFPGSERASVSPGKFSNSWRHARDVVCSHAARFPSVSVTTDAVFIGDKIVVYGPNGENGWKVFGPERVAWLVRAVHAMITATSADSVVYALGPELTILNIDVSDKQGVLCPVIREHVGRHERLPALDSFDYSQVSPTQRTLMSTITSSIACVSVDGTDCASAVVVSPSHALINAHVVDSAERITVDGAPLQLERMVSRYLWLARVSPASRSVNACQARLPRVGERVIVCYKRHQLSCWLGPYVVTSAGDGTFSYDGGSALRAGMSGAGIYAFDDFTFLGVHEGSSSRGALAASVGSTILNEISTLSRDTNSPTRHCPTDAGNPDPVQAMKARGNLSSFQQLMVALVPLDSTLLNGLTGFCPNGDLVFFPAHADLTAVQHGAKGSIIESQPHGANLQKIPRTRVIRPCSVTYREPAFREEVFVVARDRGGYFCAGPSTSILRVDEEARVFTVSGVDDDDPATRLKWFGALVVAKSDSCVLGLVERSGASASGYLKARMVRAVDFEPICRQTSCDALTKWFPVATPDRWPKVVLDQIIARVEPNSSPYLRDLAVLGSDHFSLFFRTKMLERMRESPQLGMGETGHSVKKKLALMKSEYLANAAARMKEPPDFSVDNSLFDVIVGVVLINEGRSAADLLLNAVWHDIEF